jgi:RNA polymerase sigma-70 factor (ECF subfamily)
MDSAQAQQFEAHRPLMFSIAYRMLGSATEAEDIVQDAYLRYQTTPPEQVVSHKAFLSTIVTRLCLNQLQSARAQRETYIGPWLPEPLLTGVDEQSAPSRRLELHESLSMAFLVLLEQLTPVERAVFLLREVFDYEYAEIAAIVGKSETACRKTFSRAKKHIAEHRPRFRPAPEVHRQMLDQFIRATGSGEIDGLMQILAEDVELWADGGGKVRGAASRVLRGRETVAQFVHAIARRADPQQRVEIADLNGAPALIVRDGAEARITISLEVDQGRIQAIHVIGNPDKLRDLNRMLQKSRPDTNTGDYTVGDIIS